MGKNKIFQGAVCKKSQLDRFVIENNIDKNDLCIVGSACLAVRNLRRNHDIDIVLPTQINVAEHTKSADISIQRSRYETLGISDDQIVSNPEYHDLVGEYKIIRPEIEISHKVRRRMEKDRIDKELLALYSKTHNNDWKWDLYRPKIKKPVNTDDSSHSVNDIFSILSLVEDGIKKLISDGVSETVYAAAERFTTDQQWENLESKVPWIANSQIFYLDPGEIIYHQFRDGEFSSYDMLVENLPNEMSYNHEYNENFDSSCKSGSNKIFNLKKVNIHSPVVLDSERMVLTPKTLKEYINKKVEHIPVVIDHTENKQIFDKKWFNEVQNSGGLSAKKSRIELFEETGYLLNFILWSPAKEHFDDIEQSIRDDLSLRVKKTIMIDLNKNEVRSFIDDLYRDHFASPFAIEYKKHQITKFSGEIKIIQVEPPRCENAHLMFDWLDNKKDDVRYKYFDQENDIDFHSILHSPDSFEENRTVSKLVDKYQK